MEHLLIASNYRAITDLARKSMKHNNSLKQRNLRNLCNSECRQCGWQRTYVELRNVHNDVGHIHFNMMIFSMRCTAVNVHVDWLQQLQTTRLTYAKQNDHTRHSGSTQRQVSYVSIDDSLYRWTKKTEESYILLKGIQNTGTFNQLELIHHSWLNPARRPTVRKSLKSG